MAKDDVQVINHHQANLNVKERVNKAGNVTGQRSYMTIEVHSEPITVMLDEGAVAKKAAEMLAQRIREQTKAITKTVDESTAKARRKLEKAFAQGKTYAVRQFTGGRTGVTPPHVGSNQAFNHSGRLANGIVAQFVKSTKEWAINFPANRWDPKHWGDLGKMQVAFQKWVALVPVLQDASSDIGIRKAIEETFGDVLQKQKMDTDHKTAMQRGRSFVELVQKAGGQLRGGGYEQAPRDDEEAA